MQSVTSHEMNVRRCLRRPPSQDAHQSIPRELVSEPSSPVPRFLHSASSLLDVLFRAVFGPGRRGFAGAIACARLVNYRRGAWETLRPLAIKRTSFRNAD